MNKSNIFNGISVDLEEYFHASNLLPYLKNKSLESRLEFSLDRTLEVLSLRQTRATFFILGEVAKQNPSLIKKIALSGHEIAAHSYTHRCVYELTASEFEAEASKVKELLEQITGQAVLGYRAPNFSINDKTTWARPILAKLGYKYDSSVYPVHHPRYSNPNYSRFVENLKTEYGELLVVPLATYPLKILSYNFNLPIAGGAYWRLLPKSLIQAGLRSVNSNEARPNFCYFHPWELDPGQPKLIPGKSLSTWRHYGNLDQFENTLENYLSEFNFTDYQTVLGLK